jgi:acetylornithine deacetylase
MDEVLDHLARLVAFPTVSRDSNLALIEWAADVCRKAGARVHIIPSRSGDKASLWASLGPDGPGGVLLSGHSDVVPVEGQAWGSDPFTLRRDGDRVYGRGTSDMKGFLACVLTALPQLAQRPLKQPLHLAMTFDEEVGCLGAPELIDWLAHNAIRPAIAFVGEPTSMAIVNAHKGIAVSRVTLTGVPAHSSLTHVGISAVQLAAQAIGVLEQLAVDLAGQHRDPRFVPDHTTLTVNVIEGGQAANIMASQCRFLFDIRTIPGVTADGVRAAFLERVEAQVIGPARARYPGVGLVLEPLSNTPGLDAGAESAAETLARAVLGQNSQASAVAYAAEAGQFQQAGMSTLLLGPGSIAQAHQPDEYIEISQLAACLGFLDKLGRRLAS